MKKFLILLVLFSPSVCLAADQKVKIQIVFTEETKNGTFQDALYFTQDEYAKLKQEDIDAMIKQRVDEHNAMVDNPPPEPVLTEEQLIQQKQQLLDQAAQLEAQAASVDAKITAIDSQVTITPVKPVTP